MPVVAAPSEADVRSVLHAALAKLSAPIAARELIAKHLQGPYRQLIAAEVERVLDDDVKAGRAFRYPPANARSKEHRYWTVDLERLASERVREALSEAPQSIATLKKRCGVELKNGALSADHWVSILTGLCQAGQAFQTGANPKTAKYSSVDPTAAATQPLLEALAAGPATLTQLKKLTKKAAPQLTDAVCQQTLARLVESGRLFVLPPQGQLKTERYSLTPLDARQFLAGPLEKLLETLAAQLGPAGVSRAEVAATASQLCLSWEPAAVELYVAGQSSDAATPTAEQLLDQALLQTIYDRITMVEPAAPIGALVSVRELRRALDFQNLSKTEFDRALLALADSQRVLLHAHDFPGSLSPADRAAMVEDEQGHVYIGVMLNN
jgi:hypothetical protein